MATINTIEDLTGAACNKAMDACVQKLLQLRWSREDISHHSKEITERLREAAKGVLDESVAAFIAAFEAGEKQSALACFYIPFIAAGIKVAGEFDQDQADDYWADYARQSAAE